MYLPARQPFGLELDWLRSQAFRWTWQDGWCYGLVKGNLVKVRQSGKGMEFRAAAPEGSLKADVEHFFRLDQDVRPIHDALRRMDSNMRRLVERYGAMRILRQDQWETLVGYICSANRNIDGIAAALDKLAGLSGKELSLDGVSMKSVPPPGRLAEAGRDELRRLRLGLPRIPDLLNEVACDVAEGRLDLDVLSRQPWAQARERLMEYSGIGQKIADCVCLFSLDMPDAFPVDRHIAAGLRERYGKTYRSGSKNLELLAWAGQHFGAHAGYAGQLLFYEQLPRNR